MSTGSESGRTSEHMEQKERAEEVTCKVRLGHAGCHAGCVFCPFVCAIPTGPLYTEPAASHSQGSADRGGGDVDGSDDRAADEPEGMRSPLLIDWNAPMIPCLCVHDSMPMCPCRLPCSLQRPRKSPNGASQDRSHPSRRQRQWR